MWLLFWNFCALRWLFISSNYILFHFWRSKKTVYRFYRYTEKCTGSRAKPPVEYTPKGAAWFVSRRAFWPIRFRPMLSISLVFAIVQNRPNGRHRHPDIDMRIVIWLKLKVLLFLYSNNVAASISRHTHYTQRDTIYTPCRTGFCWFFFSSSLNQCSHWSTQWKMALVLTLCSHIMTGGNKVHFS